MSRLSGFASVFHNARKPPTIHQALILIALLLTALPLSSCNRNEAQFVLTKPLRRDTVITRVYKCELHSRQNIGIRAPERGYLELINVQEGQRLKEGDLMFKIKPPAPDPTPKQASAGQAPQAPPTPRLHSITAPFSALMGRLTLGKGSLVNKGDVLTTLSDNSEMWADFNMPEARYKEYAASAPTEETKQVKLMLANGKMFEHTGRLNTIDSPIDKTTNTIPARAVFPNPKYLLRHGQTGNIHMHSTIKNALLVPQKSTFEIAGKHYLYTVDKDHVIHRKQLSITNELEGLLVVSGGVDETDTIILEGVYQAHDGEKATTDQFKEPATVYPPLPPTTK